MIGSIGGLS